MQLLSLRQVAHQLDVSVATVRRLIKRGDLPGTQIGRAIRIDQTDVEALVRRWTSRRPHSTTR